jgi:hypothetical protein
MIDPKELRELAQKATPGPWYVSAPAEQTVWYDIKDRRYPIADTSGGFTDDGNAEFIAAANPAVVLSLLDEIDMLRKIEAAARNLAKVKGRHNSEIAMNQLLEALK